LVHLPYLSNSDSDVDLPEILPEPEND